MAFDPATDPLGLDLKRRAREHREAFQRANPGVPTGLPGVGDNMNAFMQAVEESGGGGKAVRMSGGSAPHSNQLVGTSMQSGGGSMASRPSMAALRGGSGGGVGYGEDASGFYASPHDRAMQSLELSQASDAVRAAQPDFQRQERMGFARDARANRAMDREQDSNDASFDLGSGRAGARARMGTEVEAGTARQRARAGSDIYFDDKVSGQRQDEMFNRMEELRRRYSDPAIIRGQAAIAEANARGASGVQRETVRGEYGLSQQGLRNEGAADTAGTRARGSVGAAIAGAGGNPNAYVAPIAADTGQGKSMTMEELAGFARDNALELADAQRLAEMHNYKIVQ